MTKTTTSVLAGLGALGVLAAGALGSAGSAAVPSGSSAGTASASSSSVGGSSSATVSAALAKDLAFSREEERVARDLYQIISTKYGGVRPFSMITFSEQRHFDAVGTLLARYGIADPAAGKAVGTYADPTLQGLFDGWKAKGLTSLSAAYGVGVELEKRDIADLKVALAEPTPADVTQVLNQLLAGSQHHLMSYTNAASGKVGAGMGGGMGGSGMGGSGMGGGGSAGQGLGQGGMGAGQGMNGMGGRVGSGMGGAGMGGGGMRGNGAVGGSGAGTGTPGACPLSRTT